MKTVEFMSFTINVTKYDGRWYRAEIVDFDSRAVDIIDPPFGSYAEALVGAKAIVYGWSTGSIPMPGTASHNILQIRAILAALFAEITAWLHN